MLFQAGKDGPGPGGLPVGARLGCEECQGSSCVRLPFIPPTVLVLLIAQASYMMGQALAELGREEEGIARLKCAMDWESEQKLNFGTQIATAIGKAKRKVPSLLTPL